MKLSERWKERTDEKKEVKTTVQTKVHWYSALRNKRRAKSYCNFFISNGKGNKFRSHSYLSIFTPLCNTQKEMKKKQEPRGDSNNALNPYVHGFSHSSQLPPIHTYSSAVPASVPKWAGISCLNSKIPIHLACCQPPQGAHKHQVTCWCEHTKTHSLQNTQSI